MPRLLWLAPLPGLAAAAFAPAAPAFEIGAGRLRLLFELDGPGALLLVSQRCCGVQPVLCRDLHARHSEPRPLVACW